MLQPIWHVRLRLRLMRFAQRDKKVSLMLLFEHNISRCRIYCMIITQSSSNNGQVYVFWYICLVCEAIFSPHLKLTVSPVY